MIKTIFEGCCAGAAIMMGCSVYLACGNTYVGAVLFSVALLCICMQGYALFTGKVGYVVNDHSKKSLLELLGCLIGNALSTFLLGRLFACGLPALAEKAATLCAAKFEQLPLQTLIRAIGCGILMYLAVNIFREKKSALGILFCIPAFILSGFEHSIADMGYCAFGGAFSLRFILLVLAGNALGSMLLPFLRIIGTRFDKKLPE